VAFVSETSVSFPGDGRSGSFEVPVNAGDVLVALVWARQIQVPEETALNDMLVSVPSGWNRLQGRHFVRVRSTEPVWVPVWTRVTASGTASGTFGWDVTSVTLGTAGARIMRFSGMKGVAGWAQRIAANDPVVYPAVDSAETAPSGHAVRVAMVRYGGMSAAELTPAAGHTLRVDQAVSSTRLVASEQSLSEAKPAQVAASSSEQVASKRTRRMPWVIEAKW